MFKNNKKRLGESNNNKSAAKRFRKTRAVGQVIMNKIAAGKVSIGKCFRIC